MCVLSFNKKFSWEENLTVDPRRFTSVLCSKRHCLRLRKEKRNTFEHLSETARTNLPSQFRMNADRAPPPAVFAAKQRTREMWACFRSRSLNIAEVLHPKSSNVEGFYSYNKDQLQNVSLNPANEPTHPSSFVEGTKKTSSHTTHRGRVPS